MSEENKETKGRIDSCSIATRPDGSEIKGKKKDGSDYTMYKYKIGGKFFSGFKDVEEYELKRGDYCIVTYKEAPNPKGGTPYKNIVNIVGGVSPAEVEETNEKYNVTEPGTKDISKGAIVEPRKLAEDPAFFGMVSNQAIKWILKKPDMKYQESFSKVFDIIWEENLKKRKEKLGY